MDIEPCARPKLGMVSYEEPLIGFTRDEFNCASIHSVDKPMKYYKNRLDTFKNFPKRAFHPRPAELAAAGFYYLGYGDATKCFSCGITVHKWEEFDGAISEHYRWSCGSCPFLHRISSYEK